MRQDDQEEKIKTTYEWGKLKPVELFEKYFEAHMDRLSFDGALYAIRMNCISSGENPLPLIQKWIDNLPRGKNGRKAKKD